MKQASKKATKKMLKVKKMVKGVPKFIADEINPKKWYSVNEVAKKGWIFGIGFMGVKRLVDEGGLTASRVKAYKKGQVRYKIQGRNILEYLKKHFLK